MGSKQFQLKLPCQCAILISRLECKILSAAPAQRACFFAQLKIRSSNISQAKCQGDPPACVLCVLHFSLQPRAKNQRTCGLCSTLLAHGTWTVGGRRLKSDFGDLLGLQLGAVLDKYFLIFVVWDIDTLHSLIGQYCASSAHYLYW